MSSTDKSWIVYGILGAYGDPAFNSYNGTKWTFNKTRYREHLAAIANAGANAVRHLPTGGVWNPHPYGKKSQFCQFKYVNESVGWDLSQWNEAYFDTVSEFIQIENSLGLTTFLCLADNAETHGTVATKQYSPWYSNNHTPNITSIYDANAYDHFDALVDKYLSEFSGMDIVWSSGNEMVNDDFPDLFDAVIVPLVGTGGGKINPNKMTYGTTKASMFTTVRAMLAAGDRNKVIMEVHEGPTATSYKARYAPWAGTGARMLFSDDGCYTGNSTCDKTSQKPGPRPSASQWYTAVADVLATYGDSGDDHVLNFEHLPAGYTDFTKATSTTCQAATIHKMRQAYDEWAAGATTKYIISGYVKNATDAAIGGVSMGGLPVTKLTSSLGFYSCKVDSGWSGVVTPSKVDFTFSPTSKTYTNVVAHKTAQNYTGTEPEVNPSHIISGYVKTAGSVAIPRVTMTRLPNTPRTNASGFYRDTVTWRWSGSGVPQKSGYTFNPTSITHNRVEVDKADQDYVGTGTASPYTISGYVKDSDGIGILSVTMSGFPNSPLTDEDGFYEDDINSGWSGTVTPQKSDYSFVPASTVYTNITANKTNEDYVGTGQETGAVPAAPTNLTATISGATTATLTWTDNSIDEVDFHIEKSTTYPGTDGFAEIATVAAGVVTYEATGLTENETTYFRIRAYNVTGYSPYTDIAMATSPAATSTPRPAQRLANLPYPFGFKSLDEVRDYLIKLRSKLGMSDFSIRLGDIINNGPGGTPFVFPMDGVLYEMLTCDEEVLAWGWPGVENTYTGLDAAYSMTTGSYNTLGGYGSGMYLTIEKGNTFYGARSGYLGGDTEGTEETVESTSYDLKYTSDDSDHHPIIQPICSWDGMVITLDCVGADVEDYKIVGSYDGITWTTLLSTATDAASGIYTEPGCMASFKGSLWYSIYNDPVLGIIQQWDGATLTGHIKSSTYYTQVLQLYARGNELWTIVANPAYHVWNARHTDGSMPGGVPASWTSISNYDGDSEYAWNSTYRPSQNYLQETVHLFDFADSLYIACSKWNGTTQWETKILKYDDASIFTTVATITPTEQYLHPCGIVELSGTAYLFLSEFGDNGNPSGTGGLGRLVVYTSTNMSTWALWKDFGDHYGVVCDVGYFNRRIFLLIQSDYVDGANDTDVYYLTVPSKTLTKEATLATTLGPGGNFAELNGYLWMSQYLNIYRRTATSWIDIIYPDDTIGSYNSFFGLGAGFSNIVGRFNTCVGYLSDVANAGLENATAIGYRAIVGDSNTLVLGGTGAYAVNVAIGKTSASERLDIAGNAKVSGRLIVGQATGTSPLGVQSTTVNTNLNADLLDGYHATSFLGLASLTDPGADRMVFWDETDNLLKWLACGDSIAITTTTLDAIQDIRTTAGPSFDHVHSTVATGTPPFVVASTTEVANLNADLLDGLHASEIIAGYASSNIASNPMTGEYRIKALRFDSSNNIVVVYDNVAEGAPAFYGNVVSNPQIGEYKINALRLDSSKKIVVGYDNTPMIAIPGHSAIYSNPNSGEYRIRALRLNSSNHIAVVYNDVAEP